MPSPFGTKSGWNAVLSEYVEALAIHPILTHVVYAATSTDGVWGTAISGFAWEAVNTGLTNSSVFGLVLDPSNPLTIYAATNGGGVFKTTDGVPTWTAMNNGLTEHDLVFITLDPTSPQTLYAVADSQGGVFRSTDGGPATIEVTTDGGTATADPGSLQILGSTAAVPTLTEWGLMLLLAALLATGLLGLRRRSC